MIPFNPKVFFLIFCFYSRVFVCFAQFDVSHIYESVKDDVILKRYAIVNPTELKKFYKETMYEPVWLKTGAVQNQSALFNLLNKSVMLGLRQGDYQFAYIQQYKLSKNQLQNVHDSIEAELRFTDAAVHFYKDLAYGNANPVVGYNGYKYDPQCYNITHLLAQGISTGVLENAAYNFHNNLPQIALLEKKIFEYTAIMSKESFSEVIIISKQGSVKNKPLLEKLYQLGLIDKKVNNITDNLLKEKIREAQKLFNLISDGVFRTTLMDELNIPLKVRLQQLNESVNNYRWLRCIIQMQPVIVVNIPSAYLKLYDRQKVFLEMRVIVGKKSTPTPTLTSEVKELILYPYWHVPNKIATRELLPSFKRNPSLVDSGNYQILDRNGKIKDPHSIRWRSLNAYNFPYIIRQSTGCDNALGLLKLNFYNPFDVYLHDTPNKLLFGMKKRFFSHGCMRMEKPMELGRFLLKDNKIAIDTLEQKGCIHNQSPIAVPLPVKVPVFIWYNYLDINAEGKISFFEDIYQRFGKK